MAKFPVYQTERSVPGQTVGVRANLDFDVGGRQLAAAAGGLGQAASDIGMTFYRLQGEAELVQAQAQNKKDVQEMLFRFENNDDPESYGQDFQETFGAIEAREIKNGWARRQYRLALPGYRVQLEGVVQEAQRKRALDNFTNAAAVKYGEAVQTGDPTGFAQMVDSAVAKGLISGRERDRQMQKVNHDAELERFQKAAFADPETILKDLEDDKLDGAKHLDTGDLLRVRNVAVTRQRDDAIQSEAQRQKLNTGLWDLTMQPGTTGQDVLKAIDKLPEDLFPADEKDRLYKSTMARLKLIEDGQGDPLKVRQDYDAYKKLLFDATDGKASEPDFRRAVNENQITLTDYKELVNIVEGKAGSKDDAYSFTSVVKSMDALVDKSMIFLVDKEGADAVKMRSFEALEDRIAAAKDAGTPLQGRELLTEAVRIAYDMEDQYEQSGSAREFLLGTTGSTVTTPVKPTAKEPKDQKEFVAEVRRLNATSPVAARAYYDQWISKWR